MNSFKILNNNQIYYGSIVKKQTIENAKHSMQFIPLKLDDPIVLFEIENSFQFQSFGFLFNGNSFVIDINGLSSEDFNIKIDSRDLNRFQKLFVEFCSCCNLHISLCQNLK